MKNVGLIILGIVVLAVVEGLVLLYGCSISALDDPGAAESSLAIKAKRWYVARAAERSPLPPEPPEKGKAIERAQTVFMNECELCHGMDGRRPSNIGRWQYPRSSDLGSPAVQAYTDAQLFWIISNGIRLSGMPGFAHIHKNDEIWGFVYDVRSIGKQAAPAAPAK